MKIIGFISIFLFVIGMIGGLICTILGIDEDEFPTNLFVGVVYLACVLYTIYVFILFLFMAGGEIPFL